MVTINQTVNLSLTQDLIPYIIHVRQYENLGRKIICRVYQESKLVELDSDTVINVSGTRPDGNVFQYDSTDDADVVFVSDGCACFWITTAMTSSSGRIVVDVTLMDGAGAAIGTFAIVLRVEKAAVSDSGLSTGSYSSLISQVAANIVDCYIDDDGYLVIVSEDGLGLIFETDDEGNITIHYEGGSGT
ncbi:MAG: hypothetical protein LUH45_01430 [Clostridiales bacterium]|nr:hypothetical protein [Clostridiales bacterium]